MTYVLLMQTSNGFTELTEKYSGLVLWQDAFGRFQLDVLVQGDTRDELLYQINVLRCFKVVVELHDVGMIALQALHASDLPLYSFTLGSIIQLVFRVDFDGHLLLGLLMLC